MSLSSPHPIWLYAGSPFEVSKAVVAARMLSGRYRTDKLVRHWSAHNPNGYCKLPGCSGAEVGDLAHIVLDCPALVNVRLKQISLWSSFLVSHPALFPVISYYTVENRHLMLEFLLDPSTMPMVISCTENNEDCLRHCLYLSRTWLYSTRDFTLVSRFNKLLKSQSILNGFWSNFGFLIQPNKPHDTTPRLDPSI